MPVGYGEPPVAKIVELPREEPLGRGREKGQSPSLGVRPIYEGERQRGAPR